jgi:hypothetical protein
MAVKYDFSGVWRSTHYKVGEKNTAPMTDYYVTMQLIGDQLIVESIPSANGSYMMARFTLDDRIATGSYQSQNSPHTQVKGALYYGAAQLVLDPDGKALRGKGVGIGKNFKVQTTIWELVHVGQDRNNLESGSSEEAGRSKDAQHKLISK